MIETALTRTASARIPTEYGEFQLYHYSESNKEHLALMLGNVENQENVLVRVHSECFTGDVLGSLRCDCGEQLQEAMQSIAVEGCGVVVYLRQEGRGIGLSEKLRAYNLQDQGYDTVEANLLLGHPADARTYEAAAAILADLKIQSLRLITNNPAKIDALDALGIVISERVPILPRIQTENVAYLKTKVERMQHMLKLSPQVNGSHVGVNSHRVNSHKDECTPKIPQGVGAQLGNLQKRIDQHWRSFSKSRPGSRPFVTVSYAQSLDGSIAAVPGQHLDLSSPDSYMVTHALRAQHQAILVGIDTVLADDPRLNVRLVDGPNPQPVVIDSNLRLPLDAAMFSQHDKVIVATASTDPELRTALAVNGASLIHAPDAKSGRVDLATLLDELGARGIKSIMIEGGAAILSSFLHQGLADYVVVTVAPTFVGGLHALSPFRPGGQPSPRILQPTYTQVGPDILIWGALKEVVSNGNSLRDESAEEHAH